jgi:transglutaminase-like putative cysteine protease
MKKGFWTKFIAFVFVVVLFGGSTLAMQQGILGVTAEPDVTLADKPVEKKELSAAMNDNIVVRPVKAVPDLPNEIEDVTVNDLVTKTQTKIVSGGEVPRLKQSTDAVKENTTKDSGSENPGSSSGQASSPSTTETAAAPVEEAKSTPANPYRTLSNRTHQLLTRVVVTNNTEETSNNVRVDVPLISSGSVYQSRRSESFNIEPSEIKTVSGTRVAVFQLGTLEPGQEAVVEIRTEIRFSLVEFLADYVPTDDKKSSSYLSAGTGIESDNSQIISLSNQLTQGFSSDWDKARAITRWVAGNITYDESAANRNSGALAALQSRRGVCEDYAKLSAALARAAGIPARIAYGYADRNGTNWPSGGSFSLRGYRHAWVEYSLEGRGWVPAEPTRSTSSRLLFGTLQHNRYFIQNYSNISLKQGYSGGKPTISWTESLF